MIYEHAHLTIAPGREDEFEEAFEDVPAIFARAKGCRGVELRRSIENGSYLLVVAWETVTDHTIGFRESDLFLEWRAVAGPFFAEPPDVLHYDSVG
jgi:heme-degrading monooxygenase HmoA